MINTALEALFKIRGGNSESSEEGEMSFWEHLEDLRKVIFRMVVSFLAVLLLCIALIQNRLMPFLTAPVEEMWRQQTEATLPKHMSASDWARAKEVADALALLSEEQHPYFLDRVRTLEGEKTVADFEVLKLYRAVQAFDIDEQKTVIENAEGFSAETKQRTLDLYAQEKLPKPERISRGEQKVMSTLKPSDGFMTSIKVSFFSALALSFPLLLFFALQFVLPGLHKHERKVLWPALLVGFGLFLCGVSFAYWQVLPKILAFFHTYTEDLNASNNWTINDYITFVTQMCLVFGLAFELPVVVLTLVKLGLLNFSMMNKTCLLYTSPSPRDA